MHFRFDIRRFLFQMKIGMKIGHIFQWHTFSWIYLKCQWQIYWLSISYFRVDTTYTTYLNHRVHIKTNFESQKTFIAIFLIYNIRYNHSWPNALLRACITYMHTHFQATERDVPHLRLNRVENRKLHPPQSTSSCHAWVFVPGSRYSDFDTLMQWCINYTHERVARCVARCAAHEFALMGGPRRGNYSYYACAHCGAHNMHNWVATAGGGWRRQTNNDDDFDVDALTLALAFPACWHWWEKFCRPSALAPSL